MLIQWKNPVVVYQNFCVNIVHFLEIYQIFLLKVITITIQFSISNSKNTFIFNYSMKNYKCTIHLEVIQHAVHLAAMTEELVHIFFRRKGRSSLVYISVIKTMVLYLHYHDIRFTSLWHVLQHQNIRILTCLSWASQREII